MKRTVLPAIALVLAALAATGAPNNLPSPTATPNPGAVGGPTGPSTDLAAALSESLPSPTEPNVCLDRIATDAAHKAADDGAVAVAPPPATQIQSCLADATTAAQLIATLDTPDVDAVIAGWNADPDTSTVLSSTDHTAAGTAVIYDGNLGWWYVAVFAG